MKFRILTSAALLCLSWQVGVEARESLYTDRGRAPMYWIAYEQCFVEDRALDESRWRDNINWVAENLLPHGYDMVCTDGWIEGGQTVDENGYITRYNSGWGQDFSFYVKLASRKGLRSGIYYNPLWMTRAAYDKATKVKGTSVTARDIRGKEDFNDFIYWVDTDCPGAEQWVKGYVRHFIDLGFQFLRVDFLNHYENAYGTVRYRRALKWIMEEAGDEIMISLVMPNSYDHARNERLYGDMFRISEDVFGGGFDFVSQRRRGQWQNGWANWGNIYDGFLDFSDIDRSEIIMDGDFVRLNTVAQDCEKEFWITLLAMAGSPVAVADQHDTAGDNLRFLLNDDILALVKEGFHGKPLSRDAATPESNIWAGDCANGDRVVAFFNREENATSRTYAPASLGIGSGLLWKTDLWSKEQDKMEAGAELMVRLAPHSCKVYRFSATRYSGIGDIAAAEETPQAGVYSLDGIRVAESLEEVTLPGVYIVRDAAGEARKIALR